MNPLIPAWLDDLGLSVHEFRVACHLWRHKAGFKASGPAIAARCRISEDTVWKVIRALEDKGLLERRKVGHFQNTFVMKVPSGNGKQGVPQGDEAPESKGCLPPESRGWEAPESEGWEPPETEGCKGSQPKGTKSRKPNVGGAKSAAKVSDEDWLASLKSEPAYTGIDINFELVKATKWIADHPPRKLTRRFFTNWLSRAEKPLAVTTAPRALNMGKRGQTNGYNERRDF